MGASKSRLEFALSCHSALPSNCGICCRFLRDGQVCFTSKSKAANHKCYTVAERLQKRLCLELSLLYIGYVGPYVSSDCELRVPCESQMKKKLAEVTGNCLFSSNFYLVTGATSGENVGSTECSLLSARLLQIQRQLRKSQLRGCFEKLLAS